MNWISSLPGRMNDLLQSWGLGESLAGVIHIAFFIVAVLILLWLADFVTNRILLTVLTRIARRTKNTWDDVMMEKRLFARLAHLVPAIIVYNLVPALIPEYEVLGNLIRSLAVVYAIIILLRSLDAVLDIIYHIYQDFEISNARPIKGYIQIAQIIAYCVAIIWIIAVIIQKDPINLFLGLGAFAAVLVLIFKDTILGFVGSIQLSANDMVRPGDWITMPKYGADGDVLEITLTTVKVRNFDKTITTIPTYSLVSDAFQNWRGMEESEGRRIKRSINLDMTSVRFCDEEMLERFKRFRLIRNYIITKQEELDTFNSERNLDPSIPVNVRKQTNLGVFRAYLEAYLHDHPLINDEMTFLVRQLQPSDNGLPMEIYVFSRLKEWNKYESLQADIFDHILAVIPMFDLRVFQEPSGNDMREGFSKGAGN